MCSASDLEAVLSLNHASERLVATANDSQMTGISQFFAKTPFLFPAAATSHLQTDIKIYCNEKCRNVSCIQQLCFSSLKHVKEVMLFFQVLRTVYSHPSCPVSQLGVPKLLRASSIGFNSSSFMSARALDTTFLMLLMWAVWFGSPSLLLYSRSFTRFQSAPTR